MEDVVAVAAPVGTCTIFFSAFNCEKTEKKIHLRR